MESSVSKQRFYCRLEKLNLLTVLGQTYRNVLPHFLQVFISLLFFISDYILSRKKQLTILSPRIRIRFQRIGVPATDWFTSGHDDDEGGPEVEEGGQRTKRHPDIRVVPAGS